MSYPLDRLLTVGALFLVAAPVVAQSHPNFTGTWVLDSTRTEAEGRVAPPTSARYVLEQHGDTLTQDSRESDGVNGVLAVKMFWRIDGNAWVNHNPDPAGEIVETSQLKWDGPALGFITSLGGTTVDRSETWTLASDGKTLTMKIDVSVNGNHIGSNTLVFNKQ